MNNELKINMKLVSSDNIDMKLEDSKPINVNMDGGIVEIDPIFTDSPAYTITYSDINSWNHKSNFSGNYNDLTNKPTIPTQVSQLVNDIGYITKNVSNLEYYTLTTNLANVALTGEYSDLLHTPTIPTKTSDLNNDSGFITNTVDNLTNYTLSTSLSTVATTGSYSDLTNTPSLATVATTGEYSDLINKPTLSTVASTGDYDDLIDKPTIPTKTSELQNDSGYITTANIPTKTSDLQNDSGFITNAVNDLTNYTLTSALATVATTGSYSDLTNTPSLATVATSGSYNDLTNTPTIPTKTSELTNDSGFVTNTYTTTEAVCGKYLGKPLYRKVITQTVNANTNVGYTLSSLGISNTDIVIVNVGASTAHYSISTTGGGYAPIVYYVSNTDRAHVYVNANKELQIQNQNSNQREYNIVLEYTKTTD